MEDAGTPSSASAPPEAQGPEVIGGLRAGRTLIVVIYGALALAALIALGGDRFGFVPAQVRSLAPITFVPFVLLFAVYRFALVRARKYSAMKAFVQVGIAVGFLLLLIRVAPPPVAQAASDPLPRLISNRDPDVRAVAAELTRHHPATGPVLQALIGALNDPAPAVRRAAHDSLVVLAGSDVGGDGPDAIERWTAWQASRGN